MGHLHSAEHDNYVHYQEGGTCWANAITQTIISVQMKLQCSKQSKHPELVDSIIEEYGDCDCKEGCGKKTCAGKNNPQMITILEEQLLKRIDCAQPIDFLVGHLDEEEAIQNVKDGRIVIATFCLNKQEWGIFYRFFRQSSTKTTILTRDVFDNPQKYLDGNEYENESPKKKDGHAVVIVEYEDGIYDQDCILCTRYNWEKCVYDKVQLGKMCG
eukprot:475364_1